jgi:hypothetical protein
MSARISVDRNKFERQGTTPAILRPYTPRRRARSAAESAGSADSSSSNVRHFSITVVRTAIRRGSQRAYHEHGVAPWLHLPGALDCRNRGYMSDELPQGQPKSVVKIRAGRKLAARTDNRHCLLDEMPSSPRSYLTGRDHPIEVFCPNTMVSCESKTITNKTKSVNIEYTCNAV